ncbi:uncharacterized protein LOC136035988 [Artemia franciscana]
MGRDKTAKEQNTGIVNIKMRRAAQGDSQGVRHLFMQSEDDDYDEIKSRIERLRSVNIIIKDEVNDQVRELGSANSIFDSLEGAVTNSIKKIKNLARSPNRYLVLYMMIFMAFIFGFIWLYKKF